MKKFALEKTVILRSVFLYDAEEENYLCLFMGDGGSPYFEIIRSKYMDEGVDSNFVVMHYEVDVDDYCYATFFKIMSDWVKDELAGYENNGTPLTIEKAMENDCQTNLMPFFMQENDDENKGLDALREVIGKDQMTSLAVPFLMNREAVFLEAFVLSTYKRMFQADPIFLAERA